VVVLDGTASGHGAEQAQRLAATGEAISRRDGAASMHLKEGVVVVVGADAVGRRSFVNSAGTVELLELACERKLERVLVADSGKDVDEDVVEEIIRMSPRHRGPSGDEWPVFETVPLSLVSTRVTE
jgi:translation initiation factor 2B subunit (eIF-2B alpha/beta/delta family)